MIITNTISDTRKAIAAARSSGKTIGFVPTMGALHAGHYSLVQAAKKECDLVAVSIFINPTQFGPNEDLANYPRTFADDCTGCEQNGADIMFVPTPEIMYPNEKLTWVTVDKLTDNLCGSSRPNHFRGVTTVVTKLFNIIQPDIAYFGQKDAQQLSVLEKMVEQLNIPVTIKRCPIVREADGLAMSSRNEYLSEQEREQAICLKDAIDSACQLFNSGTRNAIEIIDEMNQVISEYPLARIDYISIVDNEFLQPITQIDKPALVALAVYMGQTRLIDNVVLAP